MKTRMLVLILILVLAVLIIAVSCVTEKKVIPVEDAVKQLDGVYVNTEYSGYDGLHPQKYIITLDRKIEDYKKATDKYPSHSGEYKVVESWSDSTGNIYCTVDVNWTSHGVNTIELWRLDKRGNTFELNAKFFFPNNIREYPTKIDPNPDPKAFPKQYYCIYYRQE